MSEVLQYGGWVGMLLFSVVSLLMNRRYQKALTEKEKTQSRVNEVQIRSTDIDNTKKIIDIWKGLSQDQERAMDKMKRRIGLLEGKLREEDLKYQTGIDKLNEAHKAQLDTLKREYEERYEQLKEIYEEKLATIEENYQRKVEQIEESYKREVQRLQEEFRQKCEECEAD